MDKLIYLPKQHKLKAETLSQLRAYASHHGLKLEIHIPIIIPHTLLLTTGDDISLFGEFHTHKWQKALTKFDIKDIQVDFHLVYVYQEFLYLLIAKQQIKFVFSDHKLLITHWIGKNKHKHLSRKDIIQDHKGHACTTVMG
ncbi:MULTISPECIES: hypothetical protein [Cysteiniphilum]|uniref:Uncharacterized protein n=1 Tax=Cysteiniphilum litorale TaxID=2056700 RepID=A0A8J2Z4E5_9GAMM|nr:MULTISPECIES: hypothetical protein [Cysteiniphilum]GGF97870.1 hypothetical protein GCM10010995_13850 [Cysteiniphilum litorale]